MRLPKTESKSSAKGCGPGRPVTHDLRSCIATGAKLRIIPLDLSLEHAIQATNYICDDPTIDAGAAAEEGALCYSTLRKRVLKLMNDTPWSNLRREEHLDVWTHMLRTQYPGCVDSILYLVKSVCARVTMVNDAREALPTPVQEESPAPIDPSQWSMSDATEDTDLSSVAITEHLLEFSTSEVLVWSPPGTGLSHQLFGDDEACSLPQPEEAAAAVDTLSGEDLAHLDASVPLLDDLDIDQLPNASHSAGDLESDLDRLLDVWRQSDPMEGMDLQDMPLL